MKAIQTYLESKQQQFEKHPFFNRLEKLTCMEEFSDFVTTIAFWPLIFQDVLRVNERLVTDPYLRKVARHHRLEDKGHDRWFLHDIVRISKLDETAFHNTYDIAWLFSDANAAIRDAGYAIMAEAYRTDDDYLRVILLMTLESSGHVFFERVAAQTVQLGFDEQLKYFSTSHLEVEKAHELFESSMEQELFSHVLTEDQRRQAIQMIDRAYDAFYQIFDAMVDSLDQKAESSKAKGMRDGAKQSVATASQ